MTDKEKTAKLIELVDELCNPDFSKEKISVNNWVNILMHVYANDYRHTYSDIFNKLQSIFTKDMEVGVALGENLNTLSLAIQDDLAADGSDVNLMNASKGFRKFADHINLEIGRYNFIKNQFPVQTPPLAGGGVIKEDSSYENLSNKINEVSRAVDNIRPIATQAQKGIDKVDDKLENNKISSITALTIFSAVILAFSGGITFEAGVFKGIADASPYRLVFTTSLTGFILFNTIFVLLYIVGKMTGKAISTKCKYMSLDKPSVVANRACGDGVCIKACSEVSIACRILHKYSYVFAINVVLLWVMYADFVLWNFKNIVFNLTIGIYIALPLSIVLISIIILALFKTIQEKRITLNAKIRLVSKYLNPVEANSSISGMSRLLLSLSSVLSGFQKKDIQDEFADIFSRECVNDEKQFKELLKKINLFVEENFLTDDTLADTISLRKHNLNKKKWKILVSDLKKQLITQNKMLSIY